MASVVLLVVVMEVLLVVGGRKIGYCGMNAHIHRRGSGCIAWVFARSHGFKRPVGMVHQARCCLCFFLSKVVISAIVTRPSRCTPRKPGS